MSSHHDCWLNRLIAIAFMSVFSGGMVIATPLYLQQLDTATVSAKALQKARKQVQEYRPIKILNRLSVAPFHKRAERQATDKQPFCTTCHLSLPHRKDERSRSFMNMHSRHIACETCHLRPENIQLDYAWLAYSGPEAGQQLVLHSSNMDKHQGKELNGRRRKTDDKESVLVPQPGARIAPFFKGEAVLLFKDSDFARQTDQKWMQATQAERARLKARLHAPLEKDGPVCRVCHGKEDVLLDLIALGATPQQVGAIQRNLIAQFFTRYKKGDERIRIGDMLKRVEPKGGGRH